MTSGEKFDVAIIGAGASGLIAARALSKAGKKILILEARDRIGGRIYPLSEREFGYPAQGGAEFVHGEAPVSKPLLDEADLTLNYPIEWWNVLDGEPKKVESISPHDPFLESKLMELKKDMSIAEFFDIHLKDKQYTELRDFIFRRVQGYDAADPARASAFSLREDMMNEGEWEQMSIKEGYGAMIDFLKDQCMANRVMIELQKEVASIELKDGGVEIKSQDGQTFTAQKALITVPLPLISHIHFIPALPEKVAAAANIGFGGVIKILLNFKTKWWAGAREENFERMFFMFSNEVIPTWWTQYPEPHLTLTGWVAGPPAQELSKHTEDELLELSLVSLSNIFHISVSELKEQLLVSKIVNWPNDPFARGAYSYVTPESAEAIDTIVKPIDNKLFFAGEGVYQGDAVGTVEAALASGLFAVNQILGR